MRSRRRACTSGALGSALTAPVSGAGPPWLSPPLWPRRRPTIVPVMPAAACPGTEQMKVRPPAGTTMSKEMLSPGWAVWVVAAFGREVVRDGAGVLEFDGVRACRVDGRFLGREREVGSLDHDHAQRLPGGGCRRGCRRSRGAARSWRGVAGCRRGRHTTGCRRGRHTTGRRRGRHTTGRRRGRRVGPRRAAARGTASEQDGRDSGGDRAADDVMVFHGRDPSCSVATCRRIVIFG